MSCSCSTTHTITVRYCTIVYLIKFHSISSHSSDFHISRIIENKKNIGPPRIWKKGRITNQSFLHGLIDLQIKDQEAKGVVWMVKEFFMVFTSNSSSIGISKVKYCRSTARKRYKQTAFRVFTFWGYLSNFLRCQIDCSFECNQSVKVVMNDEKYF